MPLALRLRTWIWAAGAVLVFGALAAWALGDPSVPLYAGTSGLALMIANLLNVFVGKAGRDEVTRAGAIHAVPSWRASHGWTARTFDVDQRDYDPDGSAWAELLSIARSHGYALAPDHGPGDSAWHFVREEQVRDVGV